MEKLVLSFKFENNIYVIYQKEDFYVKGKVSDNNLLTNLSETESVLFDFVVDKMISKNLIKLGNVKINNEDLEHYYDKENKWHRFLGYKNRETLSLLNKLYNNQKLCAYLGKNDSDFITRLVKYKNKTIVVMVASSMIFTTGCTYKEEVVETNIDEIPYEEEIILDNSDNLIEEKIETLKNAINDNMYLNQEEKELILDNLDTVIDNIDYINYDSVLKSYSDLKIVYNPGNSGVVYGEYNRINHTITIYNASSIKEVKDKGLIKIFTHEKGHAEENETTDSMYNGVFDPLNAIFNNEYYGIKYVGDYKNYDNAYIRNMRYIYALMEIIDSEVFRWYHFNGDISMIKNELLNLINDEAKCEELLSNMSTMFNAGILSFDGLTYQEVEKMENDIINLIGEYYYARFEEDMSTNLEIMAHFNPELIAENIEVDSAVKYKSVEIGKQKTYFNSKAPRYKESSTLNLHLEYKGPISTMRVEEALEVGAVVIENGNYISFTGYPVEGDIVKFDLDGKYEVKEIILEENFLKNNNNLTK